MSERSQRIEFPNHAGEMLVGRLELPAAPPRAFALFAHCFTCSKDIAAASRVSRALRGLGYAVLRFDFTGLGNSDGDFANTSFSSNVGDLIAAADHLRTHHQAPRLLVGHSLGGAAVLIAGGKIPEVAAVATIGAPSEPGHVKHLLRDGLDTIERDGSAEITIGGRSFRIAKSFIDDLDTHRMESAIRELERPLLVMHSPIDDIVGIEHARRIYQAARHPKSFLSLDDADHLLSRPADADYVAGILAAWAARYVAVEGAEPEVVAEPSPAHGVVIVREDVGLRQDIQAGRHALVADEPQSAGGSDLGPDPYGLLLASLGACTSMTLRMYARHKKWPLDGIAVRLEHRKVHARDCEDCESVDGKVDVIERTIELTGSLDDEQRSRLLEIADRCPVHRTLTSETRIRTLAGQVVAP